MEREHQLILRTVKLPVSTGTRIFSDTIPLKSGQEDTSDRVTNMSAKARSHSHAKLCTIESKRWSHSHPVPRSLWRLLTRTALVLTISPSLVLFKTAAESFSILIILCTLILTGLMLFSVF